jgi:hypothetical protein
MFNDIGNEYKYVFDPITLKLPSPAETTSSHPARPTTINFNKVSYDRFPYRLPKHTVYTVVNNAKTAQSSKTFKIHVSDSAVPHSS